MVKKIQDYSQLGVAIDLISHHYSTMNPIIISEKIEEDLDLHFTIHQIMDYLDIYRLEDYELESNKIQYEVNY